MSNFQTDSHTQRTDSGCFLSNILLHFHPLYHRNTIATSQEWWTFMHIITPLLRHFYSSTLIVSTSGDQPFRLVEDTSDSLVTVIHDFWIFSNHLRMFLHDNHTQIWLLCVLRVLIIPQYTCVSCRAWWCQNFTSISLYCSPYLM